MHLKNYNFNVDIRPICRSSLVNCALFILFHRFIVLSADSLTPRGVPLSRAALYDPTKDFSCLDGSKLISFSFVNDEYCDCPDGSDEPGTSACSGAKFYCPNAGHRPTLVLSSRVDDGLCDCCDGSDEPVGKCRNTCDEEGRAAKEEADRLATLARQGYLKRVEMSFQGKEIRRSKEEERIKLESERKEAEIKKESARELKEIAEAPEREALDKFKRIEEERRAREDEEEKMNNQKEAMEMFTLLDSNSDDMISADELKTRQLFDRNRDGVVDDVEVSYYLNLETEMSKEEFLKNGWLMFKPLFLQEQGLFTPPEMSSESEEKKDGEEEFSTEEPKDDEQEHDDEDIDDSNPTGYENEEEVEHPETEKEFKYEPKEAEVMKYDEETRKLIEEADNARRAHDEADRDLRDIIRKLEDVNELLGLDLGEDERFGPLLGQCFDFEDREYIYTLCPFKKASQRGKSGGGEVDLGKWDGWKGPDENKFTTMLYDRGQSCWNGPNRSVRVRIECGTETRITGVSEPSRCEYNMDFECPAACVKTDMVHDEL